MKKIFVSVLAIMFLTVGSPAYAQVGDEAAVSQPPISEDVTEPAVAPAPISAPSLESDVSPRILPGTAGYFFKELTRNFQRLVTFNPVKRTELELKISSEKAEEIKALDAGDASEDALKRAVAGYEANATRLKTRLEALKETSENPNVDRLLENISSRIVEHESIFRNIAEKRGFVPGGEEGFRSIHEDVLVSSSAKFVDPAKFGEKLKEAFIDRNGSDDTEVRAVSLINRIEGRAPEEAKKELERVKEEVILRLSERAKLDEKLANRVSEIIKNIPSGEIRLKVASDLASYSEGEVKEKIREASDALEREPDGITAEAARTAIDAAKRIVEDLASKISSDSEKSLVLHLEEAKKHLAEAEVKFSEAKFGSAFGRARSAESIAAGAFRRLVSGGDELVRAVSSLKRDYEHLLKISSEKGLTAEKNGEIFSRLEDLKNAIQSVSTFEAAKDVRRKMSELEVMIRRFVSGDSSTEPQAGRCPEIYMPVCGEDGRTYGNSCKANLVKVKVAKAGACDSPEAPTASDRLAPGKDKACITVYSPVCGEDGRTYSNSCFAEAAGIRVKRSGTCEESVNREVEERKVFPGVKPSPGITPGVPTNRNIQPQLRKEVSPEEYNKLIQLKERSGTTEVKPESFDRTETTTTPSSVAPSLTGE